jgi:hypothetical protein
MTSPLMTVWKAGIIVRLAEASEEALRASAVRGDVTFAQAAIVLRFAERDKGLQSENSQTVWHDVLCYVFSRHKLSVACRIAELQGKG